MTATEISNWLFLPTIAFNPLSAHSELASLHNRTEALYSHDLAASRANALQSRATLASALAPLTAFQTYTFDAALADATTPLDYTTLANAWLLAAQLVPRDRSLSVHQSNLSALLLQAHSLSLPTPEATALFNATTAYFTRPPPQRLAQYPSLLSRFEPVTASLLARVQAANNARAAAQASAQAAIRASALRNAWANTPPARVRQIIVSAFSPLGPSAVSWALRVASCESHYHPNSLNQTSGASGLFQFLPSTWSHTPYASQSPFNPYANALAAAWLYRHSGPGQWSCK